MTTATVNRAQARARAAVEAWSARFNPPDRHAWCLAAADAILAGTELPQAGPGTAYYRRSTAESRLETIRRIIAEELGPEPAGAGNNVDASPETEFTDAMSITNAELAQAGRKAREWMTKRDDLIRKAYGDGWTLRAIGEAVGLTHAGVRRVVERG